MKKFTKIISTCLLINTDNIDTDQIVPARFLKFTSRDGFGKYLFYDWRFDKNGNLKKNKWFDDSNHHTSKILVAGNNFGCGSSREHAVWALQDFGFKAVISSSFGDIFYNNSLKNGLLPVILKSVELKKLFLILKKYPQTKVTVDLENQSVIILRAIRQLAESREVSIENSSQQARTIIYKFPIDAFRKTCLLKGVDELGYILSSGKKIKDFESGHTIYITT